MGICWARGRIGKRLARFEHRAQKRLIQQRQDEPWWGRGVGGAVGVRDRGQLQQGLAGGAQKDRAIGAQTLRKGARDAVGKQGRLVQALGEGPRRGR